MLKLSSWKNRITSLPVFRPLVAVALCAIAYQLSGIRSELKGIRAEQVKNAAAVMRPDIRARLDASPQGRFRLKRFEGQVSVNDSEPITVKVDNASYDPIPVDIQR